MAADRYEEGLRIRREVHGAGYVDRVMSATNEFDRPMQDLANEYCWGAIWRRPGLDRRTRSLLNVAMLSALNRPNQLRGHVEGALRNGATPEEIREVLLQVAVYCGVPAAVDAFSVARDVLAQAAADQPSR
jgi:4-carboxymuconolactone decarboxylase